MMPCCCDVLCCVLINKNTAQAAELLSDQATIAHRIRLRQYGNPLIETNFSDDYLAVRNEHISYLIPRDQPLNPLVVAFVWMF